MDTEPYDILSTVYILFFFVKKDMMHYIIYLEIQRTNFNNSVSELSEFPGRAVLGVPLGGTGIKIPFLVIINENNIWFTDKWLLVIDIYNVHGARDTVTKNLIINFKVAKTVCRK